MKKTLRILLILLCLAVMLLCGWKLLGIYSVYQEGNDTYDALTNLAVTPAEPTQPSQDPADPTRETKPGIPWETAPITVDFDELLETGPDIIGWLYCADTPINYPVAQADDNDYYLYRLPDGTSNANGTLFLDCWNSPDFSDLHSIIYGHHMKSGAMFAILDDYSLPGFYEEHPVMYLLTPEQDYKMVLFAGYVTPAGHYQSYGFASTEEERQQIVDYGLKNSLFQADVTVPEGAPILTLSTCVYNYEDARFVVAGYLEPLAKAQIPETPEQVN